MIGWLAKFLALPWETFPIGGRNHGLISASQIIDGGDAYARVASRRVDRHIARLTRTDGSRRPVRALVDRRQAAGEERQEVRGRERYRMRSRQRLSPALPG